MMHDKWGFNVFAEWAIVVFAFIIFVLGLLMIFSTTSAEVLDHALNKSTHQALIRQIFYGLGGVVLAYGAWRLGYDTLLEWSPCLLCFFTLMLVLVLVPGVGKEINGSKRWLNVFGFSFQPSEFVKYLILAFFIQRFIPLQNSQVELRAFLKLVGLVGVPMSLIMIEPNNGTTMVIGATLLIVFLLTQVPLRFWGIPLACFLCIGILFASQLPYVSARLDSYVHPETDLKGKGHQPYQAKIAAGSGRFLGRGPGNSLQKLSYLPEAQNDYIAAIYAEEWGFVGILSLIIFYLLLALSGFAIAFNAPDKSGLYLGGAITILISLQAFLNMGVVSGLLPSTGLNLPLFSQGGSSLMANTIGLGVLLSIGKKGRLCSRASY
jgi:cell division protein FtsW